MKRKSAVGSMAIILITVVAMFAVCGGEEIPVLDPTPKPEQELSSEAEEHLSIALTDPEQVVRVKAIRLLNEKGYIDHPTVHAQLEGLLEDQNFRIRVVSAGVLEKRPEKVDAHVYYSDGSSIEVTDLTICYEFGGRDEEPVGFITYYPTKVRWAGIFGVIEDENGEDKEVDWRLSEIQSIEYVREPCDTNKSELCRKNFRVEFRDGEAIETKVLRENCESFSDKKYLFQRKWRFEGTTKLKLDTTKPFEERVGGGWGRVPKGEVYMTKIVFTPKPIITPTPTPTVTVTPTPEEKGIMGFEVIFAIIGLLAVAYLLRRRK